MNPQQQSLETLQDIKKIMERSSRFISLSGFSGISAGVCALIGAWVAHDYVLGYKDFRIATTAANYEQITAASLFDFRLFYIAAGTFIAALLSALFFTWIKSKKEGIPIWGKSALRVIINVSVPLIVGGIFLYRLIDYGTFGLVAPGCLIFYGLALINASKFTLDDVRYLGYMELLTGLISLWFVDYGLYFWAFGFGILHILYGASMWWKYDRK
ncbi:MAG: hypothetical protein ABIP80_05840 [Ferruginibacter sp.]